MADLITGALAALASDVTVGQADHAGVHNAERTAIAQLRDLLLTSVQLRGPARFPVRRYGAVGDGTTDDYPAYAAATAAAVAYIQATGAEAIVDFEGMGTSLFASGVSRQATAVKNAAGTGASIDATITGYSRCGLPVPPGLPARLTFAGRGTTVKGSAAAVCFAFPDRTRDYQVWQNLRFDQVTWDDADVGATTKGHCIWGNMPNFGVKMRYTSLQDVEIVNPVVLNAATDTSTNVGAGAMSRSAFYWSGDHNGPQEATQTFTRRIRTSGGTVNGGDQLYAFFCTVADRYRAGGATLGGVNHLYDDIDIGPGWRHVNTVPATQQRYQTSVYIGGSTCQGRRFSIADGYVENVGDDCIEIGGMMHGEIVAPRCKNPFFNLILIRNTGPMDSARQQINIRRARTEVTPALSGTTGAFAAPFAWIADDLYLTVFPSGTLTGGTFTLTIPLASGTVTTAPIAWNATPAQVAAAVDAVAPAVLTGAPNGGVTGYTGGAVNTTTPTTFVLVRQTLAANGRVTADSTSLTGGSVSVGIAAQGTAFGRFLIEDPSFTADGLTSSRQGRTDLLCKGPGLGVPILGIDLVRPKVDLLNYSYDGPTLNYELFMLIHANSLYANWPLTLGVRDARIRANGCNLAAGSGSALMSMVGVEGYATLADTDGMETDFTGSSGGQWIHVSVAKNQGTGIRAFVSRLKPKGQPSLAAYAGMRVGAEGAVTLAQLTSSDFSIYGNQANGLVLPSTGTYAESNVLRTRTSGNLPDVIPVPLARTASFTVTQADSGAPPIQVSAASAVAITVPQLLPGSSATYVRTGPGAVTLTAASGVTLVLPSGAAAGARVQGSSLALTWLTATSVLVEGDLG